MTRLFWKKRKKATVCRPAKKKNISKALGLKKITKRCQKAQLISTEWRSGGKKIKNLFYYLRVASCNHPWPLVKVASCNHPWHLVKVASWIALGRIAFYQGFFNLNSSPLWEFARGRRSVSGQQPRCRHSENFSDGKVLLQRDGRSSQSYRRLDSSRTNF